MDKLKSYSSESEGETSGVKPPGPSSKSKTKKAYPKNAKIDKDVRKGSPTSATQRPRGDSSKETRRDRSRTPESNSRTKSSPKRSDQSPEKRRRDSDVKGNSKEKEDRGRKYDRSDSKRSDTKSDSKRSPKRRTRSKSYSRSPDRRRRRSRSRSRTPKGRQRSRSRSPKSRQRSRSRSPKKRQRSRSRSPKRRQRSRSRSPKRRNRSRSPIRRKRSRSRSPKRQRSRSRSPNRWGGGHRRSKTPPRRYESNAGITRAVLPSSNATKDKKHTPTSEEVEAKLKAHMDKIKEKQEHDAKHLNLPSYLNPSMINVQQFKQQQEKRKLLWGARKTTDTREAATPAPDSNQWGMAFNDEATDAKFRRLMGIKGTGGETGVGEQVEKSRRVLEDLEREYERSRTFQLSRGAGGTTGIGLGFNAEHKV